MKDKLIKLLGGYTSSDMKAVGHREFESYDEMRRLGMFLPVDSAAELTDNGLGIGGTFTIRQFEGCDNNGTQIKLNTSLNDK